MKHHGKRMQGLELLEDACVLDREPSDSTD
jgi:hypothetical protein